MSRRCLFGSASDTAVLSMCMGDEDDIPFGVDLLIGGLVDEMQMQIPDAGTFMRVNLPAPFDGRPNTHHQSWQWRWQGVPVDDDGTYFRIWPKPPTTPTQLLVGDGA